MTSTDLDTQCRIRTNTEVRRLLGKIKHLRSPKIEKTLATDAAIRHWYEEARSYGAELATELMRLNPDVEELP
jgi:hypothetical protein